MASESHRLYALEAQVRELQRQLHDERAELKELKASMDSTAKRIYTAESWGRGVIWSTIALGGFATQFSEIVAWIQKT